MLSSPNIFPCFDKNYRPKSGKQEQVLISTAVFLFCSTENRHYSNIAMQSNGTGRAVLPASKQESLAFLGSDHRQDVAARMEDSRKSDSHNPIKIYYNTRTRLTRGRNSLHVRGAGGSTVRKGQSVASSARTLRRVRVHDVHGLSHTATQQIQI